MTTDELLEKATERPWDYVYFGKYDLELALRAVNSFEKMRVTLQRTALHLIGSKITKATREDILRDIRAALALAEGGRE